MDKVTKQGAYRARCVFDSFVAGRMQDGDIQGPGDLLGWDDLAADDQDTVQGQITQYLHSKNGSNNDSSPSRAMSTPSPPPPHHLPLPTTSTPALIRQTKRSHPQPPPIVISSSKDIPPLLPSPPSAAQPAGRCDHPPWSAPYLVLSVSG